MDNIPESESEPLSVRVLIPDGGKLEEPEQEEDEEAEGEEAEGEEAEGEEAEGEEEDTAEMDEEEEEAEEEQEEEAEDEQAEDEEEEEAEAEEEEDERAEKESEEGTRILHLNLDGLFLDLLGLEVDLDEVTLNLTAMPGEGNLLGNLLGAVTGLLDGGGLGDLLGLGGDGSGLSGLLPSMPDLPNLNPIERARGLASAIAGRIRELGSKIISSLPLEDLLKTFLEQLVNQLLDSGNGNGNEDAAAS